MPNYDDAGVSRSAARETVERIKRVTRGMGRGPDEAGDDRASGRGAEGRPPAGADRPGAATDRPGAATDRPGAGTDRPGAAMDRPGAATDRPGAGAGESGRAAAGSLLEIGGFAAAVAPPHMRDPVILSATDGVGTKIETALRHRAYETIGVDCVAMCVNDLICHGAAPLFFLDYLACGALEPAVAEGIVAGVATGCRMAGCALVGGETAEMPGVYAPGSYDIAGFAVGMAERSAVIDGSAIRAGDTLIGLPSTGVHSNGFSLVRHVMDEHCDVDALLTPTKIYVDDLRRIHAAADVHGVAHITGGGMPENVPRMWNTAGANDTATAPAGMAAGMAARIHKEALPDLPIFRYLAGRGIPEEEMYATFNMGIGMVIAVDADTAAAAVDAVDDARIIGELVTSPATDTLREDPNTLWLE